MRLYHTITLVTYTDKHPRYIRDEDCEYFSADYYEGVWGRSL
jgi:hypothetical protein